MWRRCCEPAVSEWWSYRLEDFLMFSPRVYARLFEPVNAAWWPLAALLLAAAGLCLLIGRRRPGQRLAALGAVLGLAWVASGLLFVRDLYQPINWAVGWLWPPLLALGALLPLLGWWLRDGPAAAALPRRVALALALWALGVMPLWAPLAGQGWAQAELPGLAPDATAIATLAWLVALPRARGAGVRVLALLAWAPVLAWCGFSALMLAAMGDARAAVLPLAAALALGARLAAARRSGG